MANVPQYRMEKAGPKTTFIFTPIPNPPPIGTFLVLVVVGLVGLALAITSFIWILLAIVAFGLAYLVIRKNLGRPPEERFTVSPTEITVGSRTVPVDTLHGLYLRNAISKAEQSVDTSYLAMTSAMVAGGTHGTAQIGAIHLARAATAAKRKQKLADTSWRVDAEISGVAVTLAHGLREISARGIVTDVQRAINPTA